MRNLLLFNVSASVLLGIGSLGCNVDQTAPADNPQLSAASRALTDQQSEQAIERADQFLRATPNGAGSAEALYLKGRGYEQKVAGSPGEAKQNLFEARTAYASALEKHPSSHTEGYIRASLSNVAFFEDDYPTAFAEASRAYPLLDSPAVQSVLLYRMGVSEQRMGRFTDADRTFQLVQSRYPATVIARSARDRTGLRQFYVQLATYNSPTSADRAIASMQNSGVMLSKHLDSSGHTLINAGPFPTFEGARDTKARFEPQFPDAFISP